MSLIPIEQMAKSVFLVTWRDYKNLPRDKEDDIELDEIIEVVAGKAAKTLAKYYGEN